MRPVRITCLVNNSRVRFEHNLLEVLDELRTASIHFQPHLTERIRKHRVYLMNAVEHRRIALRYAQLYVPESGTVEEILQHRVISQTGGVQVASARVSENLQ